MKLRIPQNSPQTQCACGPEEENMSSLSGKRQVIPQIWGEIAARAESSAGFVGGLMPSHSGQVLANQRLARDCMRGLMTVAGDMPQGVRSTLRYAS
jgi:hypothetical protein